MKALFFNKVEELERTIENYDMGNEIGIWPEATKNGYFLICRYVFDNNQIVHFQEEFKGYPKTINTLTK